MGIKSENTPIEFMSVEKLEPFFRTAYLLLCYHCHTVATTKIGYASAWRSVIEALPSLLVSFVMEVLSPDSLSTSVPVCAPKKHVWTPLQHVQSMSVTKCVVSLDL